MSNFVINIFQEQFNLIDNLPDNEKKEVLYILIQSKFNQDDCFSKQSRLSTSTSLSNLSLSVIDIISKTMRVREMNDNHGGSRKGAGAPKGNNNANKIQVEEKQSNQSKNNQKTIKLIDLQTNKLDIPGYLLKTDSYEDLTTQERYFYDHPELRPFLTQYWNGKTEFGDKISKIYLRLLKEIKEPKQSKFKKPTIDEVKSYCSERKNSVIPDKWFDHYESNGWKVGKNSMKDWKAAIRKWENSSFSTNNRSVGFQEDTNNSFLKSKTEY